MDNDAAKVVLSAYRANGADALDPAFAEALAQARQDPALSLWLEEQRLFDEAVVTRLQSVAAPASLQASLLAGAPSARPPRKVVPFPRFFLPLAAAAAVVVAGLITLDLWHPVHGNRRQEAFQNVALTMVGEYPAPRLDLETPKLAETRAFIAARYGPIAPVLPGRLATMPTLGCRVTEWRGSPLSLTCFRLSTGDVLHLIVVPKKAFGTAAMPAGAHDADGWRVAYVERGGMVMFWASRAPMEVFRRMLEI